jgi:hypothetical protein
MKISVRDILIDISEDISDKIPFLETLNSAQHSDETNTNEIINLDSISPEILMIIIDHFKENTKIHKLGKTLFDQYDIKIIEQNFKYLGLHELCATVTVNYNIYNDYINKKRNISFHEFLEIIDWIKQDDYTFDVKYTIKSIPAYHVTDSYVLDHQSDCNYYEGIKKILEQNPNAYVLTSYRYTPRHYSIYNADKETFNNMKITRKAKKYTTYQHIYDVYDEKYDNMDHFISKQKIFDLVLIKYPFDWYEITLNTMYNVYNFDVYTLISNPRNRQHIANIFGIDMVLIDIDGGKEKWYDKITTQKNIIFNANDEPLSTIKNV